MSNSAHSENRVVATAIGDADAEDYLSQLMFSQGWNIVHRSLDAASLQRYYDEFGIDKSTLIYTTNFPGAAPGFFADLAQSFGLTLVNIDSIPMNAHILMSHIRQQLRVPLIHTPSDDVLDGATMFDPVPTKVTHQRNIVVTGTTGAPGRTTVSIALARHLAQTSPVELLDADTHASNLHETMVKGASENISLTALDFANQPRELATSGQLRIIDLGALGRMATEVTDRRWQANLRTNVMEKSASALYVVPAHDVGLKRLTEFTVELPLLINKKNLIFLLNRSGSGRSDKAIIGQFESLVQGHAWGKISLDYALHSPTLPFSLRENRFTKEVAKIAALINSS
jgi:hypothetical protein